MSQYDYGKLHILSLVSNRYCGKQIYFLQDNNMVYSRYSDSYMSLEDAIEEFLEMVGEGE
jgi:hypothetical protein